MEISYLSVVKSFITLEILNVGLSPRLLLSFHSCSFHDFQQYHDIQQFSEFFILIKTHDFSETGGQPDEVNSHLPCPPVYLIL